MIKTFSTKIHQCLTLLRTCKCHVLKLGKEEAVYCPCNQSDPYLLR